MPNSTRQQAWQLLQKISDGLRKDDVRIADLFGASATRFEDYSLRQEDLLFDYSRNLLDDRARSALLHLAGACDVPGAIAAMFSGDKINSTEDRAALHVALRDPHYRDRHPEVQETLDRMAALVAAVHEGSWTGSSGKAIRDVVNIGIGGSDLGPAMVSESLADYAVGGINTHFVSNIDPSHLRGTLAGLDPETTLFIVASKSFTTLETQENAARARRWFLDRDGNEADIGKHFVAVTGNRQAAVDFGIDPEMLFPLWDWVGGRYSLWSAIGLPIAMTVGMENFRQLLAGARAMDRHFREANLESNLPVIMALLTVWYTAFFDCHSSAVIPYSQRLSRLPDFLQQLYMESLGKRVGRDNQPVSSNTGEVLWGSAGTSGQHSYFQLLHQGTEFIPVDFIAFARPTLESEQESHRKLLANCLSQGLALMSGRQDAEEPYEQVPGNRPSNTLLFKELTPYNLGQLLALYEHKVYVQSVIWNINAFDQWGVELGKQLSQRVYSALEDPELARTFDPSTANLIRFINGQRE